MPNNTSFGEHTNKHRFSEYVIIGMQFSNRIKAFDEFRLFEDESVCASKVKKLTSPCNDHTSQSHDAKCVLRHSTLYAFCDCEQWTRYVEYFITIHSTTYDFSIRNLKKTVLAR